MILKPKANEKVNYQCDLIVCLQNILMKVKEWYQRNYYK